ncbi:Lar family restriction alleviation protein [Achromobacter animicus]|uniref:Lar family restriction alleviation protein n=1 Tax=Achromobacter animicus TaxID=1389935 RepID=UPI0014658073|nr:Lar family restriction alleviation protein [Achromobacter animicus]CAB3901097.1 hypothetical protein LMG26691_04494 [Achromobacter animicus]
MKAQKLNGLQAQLKPCPYCGGKAQLKPMPGAYMWFKVRCEAYECGGTTWALMGAGEAAAAWNRRANG